MCNDEILRKNQVCLMLSRQIPKVTVLVTRVHRLLRWRAGNDFVPVQKPVLSGENRSAEEGKITCSLSVTGLLMIITSVACEL